MIREAWNADALAVYRWFADLPAFDGLTRDPACAYFVDLRFLTPGRDAMPFRYGACRDAPGAAWRLLPPQLSLLRRLELGAEALGELRLAE